jgi:hypothetical protein
MSIASQARPMIMRDHVNLKCRCGRMLRAKLDQAGSSITCWDCHAAVSVPIPVAPADWVVRLLRMGARQLLEARVFTLLAMGAVVVTLGLGITHVGLSPRILSRIPTPGIWFAGIALSLVMIGYGELLRRGSQGDWTSRPRVGWLARAWRTLICLSAGFALILPLVYASGSQTVPRVTIQGLTIAVGVTLIMPLVMLGTYAPRGTVSDRLRMVGSMLARHPMAVLASLLLLPLSLIVIEAAVYAGTRISSDFQFLLIDVFPHRESISMMQGVPIYTIPAYPEGIDYRVMPEADIRDFYIDSLKHGYSLMGAIPASLALETSNGFDPTFTLSLDRAGYVAHRMGYTLFVVLCILAVMAIQARWLGLLSTLDTRKTAASSGPTEVHALPQLEQDRV